MKEGNMFWNSKTVIEPGTIWHTWFFTNFEWFSMKTLFPLPILLLSLISCSSETTDLQKGLDAANNGDFETALREWTPLAEQGDAEAQFNVGLMYESGQGVLKDYKTAVKWYTLAAEQGNAKSQYYLGMMYYEGEGVIQDNIYAHMWGNIATSNGNDSGSYLTDLAARKMTYDDISAAQKLARECLAKNYKGC